MKLPVNSLRKGAQDILEYLGETPENAEKIANNLVMADMRGISTHGIYLLEIISMRVKGEQINLPTNPKVISNDGATAIVDGENGIGIVATHRALEICIEKANQFGIGIVLIRNTNNIGSLASYTKYVAEKGMIAI